MEKLKEIFIGNTKANFSDQQVEGTEVTLEKEIFYKISNVDSMRPFFMSIVSDSNHWMFISSNGGLSAGRKDANNALFPYYTDDKITEMSEVTGSKTILLIEKNNKTFLWEPFSSRNSGLYNTTRNLYKNALGNKLKFEEINQDLGIVFSYEWNNSDRFGFIRKSSLNNTGNTAVNIKFIDGIQNILPWGVPDGLQLGTSNLVDAYKKNELRTESGLGIFSLSAIIVDRAEPSEALKANIAWQTGLENPAILISSKQLDNFRKGIPVNQENDVRAEKGAYLLHSETKLTAGESQEWMIVTDVNKTITDIVGIENLISKDNQLISTIEQDVEHGSENLIKLVGAADGIQLSSDTLKNIRHFSNTMFNLMRGGIFDNHYVIEKVDFVPYIKKSNKEVYSNRKDLLSELPEKFTLSHLQEIAEKEADKDFQRLCLEYLPLKFSRRHGDPSRPWNKFSINTKNEDDGSKILDYQGNWRDIFQNWEALAHSYPEFIEGMIHKFLNATTFDGYNPYRVTKFGFDWETIEPDNPWAYIGYWGDHQIIYLQKFLEFIHKHYPEKLKNYFSKDMFVYANVPYRIKEYEEILKDPKNTIDFLFEEDKNIRTKRTEMGVDGALIQESDGGIYHVNFIEKILATTLAKVSNFIPEAGIWLNTQRPEWNDANNALVGNGTSMVTLYYLRRFLRFFENIFEESDLDSVEVSGEIKEFFSNIFQALESHKSLLNGSFSDKNRKSVMNSLGQAASDYRKGIYTKGFSGGKATLSKQELLNFVSTSIEYLEHSIRANKRNDNLYHAYNLITIKENEEVSISYLPEMLEGQVALLSSGYLSPAESLEVLNSLRSSKLYREDQASYILYPNKQLPLFVNRNNIPEKAVQGSTLLKKLLENKNQSVISQDLNGDYHFNGNFNNVNSLKEALHNLPEEYQELVKIEGKYLFDVFENIFNHKAFTGRSGTFYGYEGLGSIYWHMVSKLLLATLEVAEEAHASKADVKLIENLKKHFHEINEGIGVHKTPLQYGAFPTDAYSHTPGGKGAQQPGMTGQVKEDILSRFGELGVKVKEGTVIFEPLLLEPSEFNEEAKTFEYVNLSGEIATLALPENSLAFTICQVPVIYVKSQHSAVEVFKDKRDKVSRMGNTLERKVSQSLMSRTGNVFKIVVYVPFN